MDKPSLSVTVCNYNHGHYLEGALNAILAQSYPVKEVIVIDDASTDNSVEIIQRFTGRYPHLSLHVHRENKGLYPTVKEAMELASGEYMYLAAADDLVYPGLLEKSMNLLIKYPRVLISCTNSDSMDESGTHLKQFIPGDLDIPEYIPPERIMEYLRKKWFILGWSCILKREAFLEMGGFIVELGTVSDLFSYYLMAFTSGVCYVNESLAAYRLSPHQYNEKILREPEKFLRQQANFLHLMRKPEYSAIIPQAYQEFIIELFTTRQRASLKHLFHVHQTALIDDMKKLKRKTTRLDSLIMSAIMLLQKLERALANYYCQWDFRKELEKASEHFEDS